MNPYGLTHQVRLPEVYTAPLSSVTYNPTAQLNVTGNGVPLVRQRDLLWQCTVTWDTPNRDNKTDPGG